MKLLIVVFLITGLNFVLPANHVFAAQTGYSVWIRVEGPGRQPFCSGHGFNFDEALLKATNNRQCKGKKYVVHTKGAGCLNVKTGSGRILAIKGCK